MVLPGIGAGPDRHEAVAALGVGHRAAGAGEVGVERSGVPNVSGVVVAAGGVGLPHLDQRVGDGAAVAVDDPAVDDDALTERLAGVLAGEVVIRLPHPLGAEQGAGDLGEVLGEHHQRPVRRPPLRASVVRPVVRRVHVGVAYDRHDPYGRPT